MARKPNKFHGASAPSWSSDDEDSEDLPFSGRHIAMSRRNPSSAFASEPAETPITNVTKADRKAFWSALAGPPRRIPKEWIRNPVDAPQANNRSARPLNTPRTAKNLLMGLKSYLENNNYNPDCSRQCSRGSKALRKGTSLFSLGCRDSSLLGRYLRNQNERNKKVYSNRSQRPQPGTSSAAHRGESQPSTSRYPANNIETQTEVANPEVFAIVPSAGNVSSPVQSASDNYMVPEDINMPSAMESSDLQNDNDAEENEDNSFINVTREDISAGEVADSSMLEEPVDVTETDETGVENRQPVRTEVAMIRNNGLDRTLGTTGSADTELGTLGPSDSEINKRLLSLLECPVCLDWMSPPVMQCRRGHLVCASCRSQMRCCPVCRAYFSSVRNRAMEQVAEKLRYPCHNGCGAEIHLLKRSHHEASCPKRTYRCLMPSCTAMLPQPYSTLLQHHKDKHASVVLFRNEISVEIKLNSQQSYNWMLMAHNELFHVKIDVDIYKWGISVYVIYIGPKINASKFIYQITIVGKENAHKLTYSRTTHSDAESVKVAYKESLSLTMDQALSYIEIKDRLWESGRPLPLQISVAPISS